MMKMFKVEMENYAEVVEVITNDFDTALEELVAGVDDVTANGHIYDMTTGEVLVQIANGEVVYIASDILNEMIAAIGEENPELAMFMALMALVMDL